MAPDENDIRVQGLREPVDIAEYLFRRLHELGVRSVFGLPGDYNLSMLDYVPKAGLKWVGSVNELNAGVFSSRTTSSSYHTISYPYPHSNPVSVQH